VSADTITADEAIARLPEGEYVHTFRNPSPGMVLGADWTREAIVEAINAAPEVLLTGEAATAMGHGMAIVHDGRPLFIATASQPASPPPSSTARPPRSSYAAWNASASAAPIPSFPPSCASTGRPSSPIRCLSRRLT